jgi:hypothetical protein
VSRLWCVANVDGKKKSDEEAKKKQRIGLARKRFLKPESGFQIQ